MFSLSDLPYDLEKYVNPNPVTNIGGVSIVSGTTPEGTTGRLMFISSGSGFGYVDMPTSKGWLMRVSDLIDYEVSFWYKQASPDPSFELSINNFSCKNVALRTFDVVTGIQQSQWIKSNERVTPLANKWYFASYILYNKFKSLEPSSQPLTSLAAGTNLIMEDGTANVIINLLCTYSPMYMWGFKFKPLNTPFSTGFVQGSDLLEVWRKNNNSQLTEEKVDSIAANLLFPYNTGNVSIKL